MWIVIVCMWIVCSLHVVHMWIVCVLHVNRMWFTCELSWVTCELYVIHMWIVCGTTYLGVLSLSGLNILRTSPPPCLRTTSCTHSSLRVSRRNSLLPPTGITSEIPAVTFSRLEESRITTFLFLPFPLILAILPTIPVPGIACELYVVYMWNICGRMWTVCGLHVNCMWFTCDSRLVHMWIIYCHMWTVCGSHVTCRGSHVTRI